jgi:pyridoxal phosphate enzyme (YggS family)
MLVAVSKQQPSESIRCAFAAGQRHFGESYVQEAADKQADLGDLAITWHFLGRIQANKTRAIATNFDWVHSIDRQQVARRLNEQRPEPCKPLEVLIQVNQAGETQKSGVSTSQVESLARFVSELPRLRLRGLMTIPSAGSGPTERAHFFAELYALGLRLQHRGFPIDTWSMGMSEDFELAIAEGSNCVRIGTAIFGPRPRQRTR